MTTTKSPMAEQPDAGRAPGLRGLAARLRDERAAIRGERLTSEDAPFWFVTPALGWSVSRHWLYNSVVTLPC